MASRRKDQGLGNTAGGGTGGSFASTTHSESVTTLDKSASPIDSRTLLDGPTDLIKVPPLPQGFENPEIDFGRNKHTDDPEVRLRWNQGYLHHTPSVDGEADSYTETGLDGVDEDTVESLEDYAWCVGRNFAALREKALDELMKEASFTQRLTELSVAGGDSSAL